MYTYFGLRGMYNWASKGTSLYSWSFNCMLLQLIPLNVACVCTQKCESVTQHRKQSESTGERDWNLFNKAFVDNNVLQKWKKARGLLLTEETIYIYSYYYFVYLRSIKMTKFSAVPLRGNYQSSTTDPYLLCPTLSPYYYCLFLPLLCRGGNDPSWSELILPQVCERAY